MTRKKRRTPLELERQHRAEIKQASRYVEQIWPTVEEISIDMEFRDPDDMDQPGAKRIVFNPDSRGHFEISCPYRECVSGGFDFGSEVWKCIAAGEAKADGELECAGWQDRERIGKHRCMLKAIYNISVKYN